MCSIRSELAPNFLRLSLASCAFSFSIVSGVTMTVLGGDELGVLGEEQSLQLGDIVGQLIVSTPTLFSAKFNGRNVDNQRKADCWVEALRSRTTGWSMGPIEYGRATT